MKVSLSWLRDYVSIEKSVQDLAEALTMAGLEVDGIIDRYGYLDDVFIGKITEVKPHPQAEKLTLCQVSVGNRLLPVVCGAPNVDRDMLAPIALPGTVLADGSILKSSVIRGEPSEGMLCSEMEIGLGTDRSGIMALNPSLIVGEKLAAALKLSDTVLELDLTPNRSDCLSILGVAREIAAIQKTPLKYPENSFVETVAQIADRTSVTIEAPTHCPRYAAKLLIDIHVTDSPFWLQDRLLSVGLRPINNIVDITNFVMMETGQPLHAFDFDRLAENRIVVRTARKGETFTTLDRKDRILSEEMLMICDGRQPVGIAGVMGGLNSEIEHDTTCVLLESACFNPVSIRKTAKKLGLSTDASHRFERGVDPMGTVAAADRAARLMADIGKAKLIGGVIDEHPGKSARKKILLHVADTNRILGTELDQDDIASLLTSIEFDISRENNDALAVVPPSFRVDVHRPEDLMEEVARLSGYNNIPTTFPLIQADTRIFSKRLNLKNQAKNLMNGFGFTEAITYSFIHELSCDRLGIAEHDPRRNTVGILNPLTEDQAVMRTSLIPGLLATMHRNLSLQTKNLRFFELGKIFVNIGSENLPEEIEMLAGLWTGTRGNASWHAHETACDFYDIKGVVEALLEKLNIEKVRFTAMNDQNLNYTKPGKTARIFSGDVMLGLVGELSSQVIKNYDLKQSGFIFELNLEALLPMLPDLIYSKPIPKYPFVSRDVTIIVDESVETNTILQSVRASKEVLVEDIRLFDVFQGDPIPPDQKSISFRITYRSPTETLLDETVNSLHRDMTLKLVKAFDARLPG
jgi:phenylalanyl-tRNA synthetase beta chain